VAFFICQACGSEYEAEDPQCPSCGGRETIRLNRSDRLVDKLIAGRFKIIRKIGQGGMGAVYLAEQIGIGHRVAIKFLKSEYSTDVEIARRFLNEAKTYAKVVHPNAVTFHEFGQDDEGNLFIAMEYCEGVDLKKTIAARGRLSIVEAIEVTTQVADVLADAHSKQIVHRDLKPENIMIRQGLRGMHAKVLDFGIARLMDASTKLTVAGAIAGTPRYMSPEQVEGREVDIRADVYALGVVCFEALTGHQAFDGATIAEIMRKQVMEPLPRLGSYFPELDLPPLQAALDKACAKRRDDRYPDMIAFASALSQSIPTQLHMSLPPLHRMNTEVGRASVSMATPEPSNSGGVALPGTLAGKDAIESTLLQTPSPTGARETAASATAQVSGVGSMSPTQAVQTPRTHVPDLSMPPRVQKSKGPMIGVIIVALVALIGVGAAVLLDGGKPTVQANTNTQPQQVQARPVLDAPQADDTAKLIAAAAAKQIHEQAAYEKLKSAQTNWEKGDLNSARIDLENVEKDTEASAKALALLADIKKVQSAITQGDAQRSLGQCSSALKSYGEAAKLNGNVDAVKRGIGACRAAAIPDNAE
jgi:eukaryotic-like serine/threonine-protein kinase